MTERVLLSVEITPRQMALLKEVAESSSLSVSAVVRAALAQVVWDGYLVTAVPPIRSKFIHATESTE